MRFPDARILMFARAPVPGRVKTRLIPALGAAGACALYRACLEYTAADLLAARLAPLELWCTPDARHPALRPLLRRGAAPRRQRGTDLGARMHHAAARALRRARRVVLIGSDVPALRAADVAEALRALDTADLAMRPAEDGGYVLLGLREPCPALFADMPWGGERVADETRRRAAALGLRLWEGAPLWDLDRPADLARLSSVPGLRRRQQRPSDCPPEGRSPARRE